MKPVPEPGFSVEESRLTLNEMKEEYFKKSPHPLSFK